MEEKGEGRQPGQVERGTQARRHLAVGGSRLSRLPLTQCPASRSGGGSGSRRVQPVLILPSLRRRALGGGDGLAGPAGAGGGPRASNGRYCPARKARARWAAC
jgi:hypothetical protein